MSGYRKGRGLLGKTEPCIDTARRASGA